ncbi:T9SS type A sorting domain-containing protein [Mucilaginibacter sp. AW1-3]
MKNFTQKMRHLSVLGLVVAGILVSQTARSQIAFPGALGFGANATGGRTGTVYHVTNLNDSGVGSFRDAVSQSNRIVVFDVGGYIQLKTAVSVKSNITIAGQTAPGGGIGFRGGEVSFASSTNIICRYIRIRPGSETASTDDDALSFYRATNVIVDHSSIEFAPWNNVDGVSDDWQNHPVNSITIQHSLIADPTGQQFGAHTEAVNGTWSWFYNIFANSHNRNPLAKINTVFVNNVLYNCSAGYTTHTSTNFKHDIINNYFVFGPASTGTDNSWYQIDKNQSIYYSGNMKDNNLDGTLNGSPTTPYWYQGPGKILTSPWSPFPAVTIYSAATAYQLTTSDAGALPRDQMDSLIINQVRTVGKGTTGTIAGTTGPGGALYTSQAQTDLPNNGYGVINGGTKSVDTDNDGMPDYWEKTMGSNPAVDDSRTLASDGYTRLEHYINWLADPHAVTSTDISVDVDLYQYTGGFDSASPVYAVSSPTNGTAQLLPDGHTVRFTPTFNFSGMGSFGFSVTTADGVYSNTVAVLTVNNQAPQVITFNAIPTKKFGGADFDSGATSNAGLPLTYSVSDSTVATVVNGKIHIVGLGTTTITATQAGNAAWSPASATQTLTVTDQSPPVITLLPGPVLLYLDANGSASVSAGQLATVTDDVTAQPKVTLNASAFTCQSVGSQPIIITATDDAGNTSRDTTNVMVKDTIPPTVISKNIQVALVNGATTITPDQVNNGSYDNCGIKSISVSPSSFACGQYGDNTVTLTVTDNSGNTSSKTATVTILGVAPTPAIAISRTDQTYTGLPANTLAIGYGAQNLTLTASNSTSAASASHYQWSPATGLSNATSVNPVFTPVAPGSYVFNVTVTNEFGCTALTQVTVNVIDVRCGNKNDKVAVCHATGSSNNPSNQICVSANAVPAQLANGGSLGSCQSFNNTTFATTSTGTIQEATAPLSSLTAYPNPFGRQTTLSFTLPANDTHVTLEIYNSSGTKLATLFTGSAQANVKNDYVFDASRYAPGYFIARLTTSAGVQTFRLVMAH